jgi:hypothetical protein
VDRKVKGLTETSTTLKDVNYLMVKKEYHGLTKVRKRLRIKIKEALRKDVEFLRSHGLMDYSLLLGVEKADRRDTVVITAKRSPIANKPKFESHSSV